MTTNMLEMENKKTYTLSYPKKSPDDNDVTVTDTTTAKVVFTNSRIIFTSQTDTAISSSQKSKTVLKWIYDGSFSFTGNTLATIKSANIDQITFAGYGLGYNTKSNLTHYSNEGAGAFRFDTPYKNLNTALLDTVKGSLLYNYSSSGENTLVPFLGGRLFSSSSVPVSTDRSVIIGELGSTELKPNWWVDPFSSQTEAASSPALASRNSTFSATTAVDTLTGTAKKADTFQFSSSPNYNSSADRITNFSTKDKDKVLISSSVFGLSSKGTFKIANNLKSLDKLSKSKTQFIYSKADGGLYFNQNGTEAGYGTGGIFAVLEGNPTLGTKNVSVVA